MTSLSTEPLLRARSVRWKRLAVPGLVALLMACGLASRAAPLLNQDGRLLRQFPTEDGYLMLTIARNIGMGKGMSTADGTIPTNGTQPGVSLLWALCYWLVGGDKALGVAVVQAVQIVFSLLAAWALYRLGRLLLAGRAEGGAVAGLATGLWYAAPQSVQNSMNCLETGAYAAVVLAALGACLAAWRAADRWGVRQCLVLGGWLGLCFWVRNDAVLLIGAVCVVRALSGLGDRRFFARRLGESAIVGLTTLCLAMPWLIHNLIRFGHIMPISGVAEAMNGTFGGNVTQIPPKLAEYALVVGGIPEAVEQRPVVLLGCLLVIVVFAAGLLGLRRRVDAAGRAMLAVSVLFAVLLAGFYGLLSFGAGHFVGRYLFAVSAPLALVTVAVLADARRRVGSRPVRGVGMVVAGVAAVCVVLALNVRIYVQGRTHIHFQMVEWVQQNVPEEAWVGAPQTGAIGYFHDRTINLDGKVNPEALRARMRPGSPNGIPQYILDKNIEYIVDWAGVGEWVKLPVLRDGFELVVLEADRGMNGLAVLRRLPV